MPTVVVVTANGFLILREGKGRKGREGKGREGKGRGRGEGRNWRNEEMKKNGKIRNKKLRGGLGRDAEGRLEALPLQSIVCILGSFNATKARWSISFIGELGEMVDG
jgi:hypothetical protein